MEIRAAPPDPSPLTIKVAVGQGRGDILPQAFQGNHLGPGGQKEKMEGLWCPAFTTTTPPPAVRARAGEFPGENATSSIRRDLGPHALRGRQAWAPCVAAAGPSPGAVGRRPRCTR